MRRTLPIRSGGETCLHTARLAALRQLIATTGDAGWKEELKRTVADLAQVQPRFKKVRFRLEGPSDAAEVTVAGTFNFWAWRANRLARQGNAWVGEVEAGPGRHAYKSVVDGRWLPDPANPRQESADANSNSVLVVE